MKVPVWIFAIALGACLLLGGRTALADAAANKAAAEALFQEGVSLYASERYEAACRKFQGSQQLEPALGTLLRLADCYDKLGKTASAWGLFHEAEELARRRGQLDRAEIARARAADLDRRLSKVEVVLQEKAADESIEVLLDGRPVPRASWGTALPVDPGKHEVVARGKNRKTWSRELVVTEGPSNTRVEIPALVPLPPQRGVALKTTSRLDRNDSGSTQRTLAYALGGAGLVGLAAGAVTGYRAYSLNEESLDHCRPDDTTACDAQGIDLRSDARTFATLSTIASIAGAVLVAGGVTLLVTLPETPPSGPDRAASAAPSGLAVKWVGQW